MRISDWSSDVCSSDLRLLLLQGADAAAAGPGVVAGGRDVILYPAIDLKDGQCVRLLRGAMDAATVYNDDPAAQARAFRDAGCAWVHVRPDGRRGGHECGSTCRHRVSQHHLTKNSKTK